MDLIPQSDILKLLKTRAEFVNITIEDISLTYLNMFRSSANVFNQEWTDFNTLSAENSSDGEPRYVYVGIMYIGSDGAQLSFNYRGNLVITSAEVTYATLNALVLFDETVFSGATANLFWQFRGYLIDRGA